MAGQSSGKWQPAHSKSVCSNVVQRFMPKAKAMQPQPATLTCICAAAPVASATGPALLKDSQTSRQKKPHTDCLSIGISKRMVFFFLQEVK